MANKDSCLSRITFGAAFGCAFGAALGAVLGTCDAFIISRDEPFRRRTPAGLLKIRHAGQITLCFAASFGFLMGVGSLLHCGRSEKERSLDITNNKNLS